MSGSSSSSSWCGKPNRERKAEFVDERGREMKDHISWTEPPGGSAASRSVLSRARCWSAWLGPLAVVAVATGLVACTPPPPPPGEPIAVYAGYYDTHHAGDPQPK